MPRDRRRRLAPLRRTCSPRCAEIVLPLLRATVPLVAALGRDADRRSSTATGRWATSAATPTVGRSCSTGRCPGRAPAASELTWYLAINRARLPQTKEATIEAYRAALEPPRRRHRSVVGSPARARAPRRRRAVRVGEGARRRRRAGVVGGARGHGRGAPGVTRRDDGGVRPEAGFRDAGPLRRSISVKPARRSRSANTSTGQ